MYHDRLYQTASIVAGLVAWQLAVGTVVSTDVVLAPTTIAAHTLTLLGEESFVTHVSATLRRTLLASVAATVVGVTVGTSMGWSERVKTALAPLFSAVYPIPVISLLPLVILVVGTGGGAIVFTAALGGYFVMLWNAMNGARQVRSIYVDAAVDNGATGRVALFREVLLPGSLPAIFVGLRLATNTALLLVISAELLIGDSGLGYFLWVSYRTYSLPDVYAALVLAGLVGVGITYGLGRVEETLVAWNPTDVPTRSGGPPTR